MIKRGYRTRLGELKRRKEHAMQEAAGFVEKVSLTWEEIADATGLSRGTIMRYASEIIDEPPWRIVRALTDYFGVTDDELMYEVQYTIQDGEKIEVDADPGQRVALAVG